MLTDLLELVHMLTRLRSVPGLRTGNALPEAERTRGAALADQLSVPVLSRAWQMLLKGLTEVEAAPDRRAAAEMVLIPLCAIVADVPPPGELVRRLLAEGCGRHRQAQPRRRRRQARRLARRCAPWSGGGPVHAAAPATETAPVAMPANAEAPRLAGFRDVVALCSGRDPTLHSHLRHSVHLVRFQPGVIELRPEPVAPRDLAPRLGALLLAETGRRWTIALSTAPGEPTLGEQEQSADTSRRHAAAEHPLVRAIMDAFPGATIAAVRDSSLDAYGLPRQADISLGEPDMPGFAPPDAEPADMMEDDT